MLAFYAMSHLTESNKFRETNLRVIRDVVQSAFEKYKDWSLCEQDFLKKYGPAKNLVRINHG